MSKTKPLVITLIVIAMVVALIAIMPKPIDMDLDKVGNGQKSVVFIYDPNSTASNAQSTEINQARELLTEPVNFLVAKIGDPKGEAFKNKYRVDALYLLFFDERGKLYARQYAVMSAAEITAMISKG